MATMTEVYQFIFFFSLFYMLFAIAVIVFLEKFWSE